MSLFLEERMKEAPNPGDGNVAFTYPWIIDIAPQDEDEDDRLNFCGILRTSYQYRTQKWVLELRRNRIEIFGDDSFGCGEWVGSSCFISYELFYDNDMRFLLHSTPRIKMAKTPKEDIFETPDGFMTKFVEALNDRKLSTVVIHIELHLPWFYRPFNNPFIAFTKPWDEYPPDMENHYKFAFLKTSDYSIKCHDGIVPASKIILNATSKFMKKHFKESNGNELVVNYSMDVVKPVIYYLHSVCFEMPKSFDFEYVHRLFKAIDYFKPHNQSDIFTAVHLSLDRKFVDEPITNFDSLLRWLQISCRYSIKLLQNMVITMIAEKYYFKWHQVFPVNARNIQNPIYRDVFGIIDDEDGGMFIFIFRKVEEIMKNSLKTNIILT